MLPRLIDKTADTPGDKILWGVIFTLLVGQIIAFWMLCSDQVHKAQARYASIQVERMALAECSQYTPRSIPARCADRMAPHLAEPPENTAAAVSLHAQAAHATPVSYVLGR